MDSRRQFHIHLSDEMREDVRESAYKERVSMAEFVRIAIREKVERLNKNNPVA